MKTKIRRNCRAFTFVEVLAVSAFTSMLIGCFYAGMSSGVNLNESSIHRIVAQDLCQEQIDLIRESPFEVVSTCLFPVETIELGHLEADADQLISGIRSSEIKQLKDPNWKEITVTVTWTSGSRSYSQSVTGYAHKGGSI